MAPNTMAPMSRKAARTMTRWMGRERLMEASFFRTSAPSFKDLFFAGTQTGEESIIKKHGVNSVICAFRGDRYGDNTRTKRSLKVFAAGPRNRGRRLTCLNTRDRAQRGRTRER